MPAALSKSSSRRGYQASSTSYINNSKSSSGDSPKKKKAPLTRSRSVVPLSSRQSDITSEFLNRRDNPLFSDSPSSPSEFHFNDAVESQQGVEIAKFDDNTNRLGSTKPKSDIIDSRRGRSVMRNSDVWSKGLGNKNGIGRSMSRVDTGHRNRSVSRGPLTRLRGLNSESESDQESGILLGKSTHGNNLGSVGRNNKIGISRSSSTQSLQTCPKKHSETSDDPVKSMSALERRSDEDVLTIANSSSGSEDRNTKGACEQMQIILGGRLESNATSSKIYETVRAEVRLAISEVQKDLESAILRSDAVPAITNEDNIASDSLYPGELEFDFSIRSEYAHKLEQSQERARKLRADLAVEENRERELAKILKEILPDSRTPNVQKSRPARKGSIERRKMSKRLTEDAMAYFDECVSLSTFDSSDFSSQEDGPLTVNASITSSRSSCLNDKQVRACSDDYVPEKVWKSQFPFGQKATGNCETQLDIQKFIRKMGEVRRSNHCDLGEYKHQAAAESLLIDRVLLKSRRQSGSMLLCCPAFASLI